MSAYYLVHTYLNNKFISSSDILESKKDAEELKILLDANNFNKDFNNEFKNIIFYSQPITETNNLEKTNNKSIADTYEIINIDNKNNYSNTSNFKIYKYGSGFLLRCNKNNPYYGMDKFENGYWIKDMKGWFFRKNHTEKLEKLGEFTDKKIKFKKRNLSNMIIYKHKKNNLLLKPFEHTEFYGIYYFLGGTWCETYEGWVFKKNAFNRLIKYGAFNDSK
tara:strand:- start:91 stop:750 length:660 start_codon:yes stop_codon:yes gene_type:complete